MQADVFRRAVETTAEAFGRPVSEDQVASLSRYFDLLLLWNARINLTGARSLDALVAEHLPDSFALDRLVPDQEPILDVGSGGGLPAIPFRLLRETSPLTLLEPRTRRAAFLRTALRELGLQAEVDTRRLEQIATTYQTVSGRAVLPPDAWVPAAAPRLVAGGRIIVYLPDTAPWTPPPGFAIADRVAYPAGPRTRLALAVTPTSR